MPPAYDGGAEWKRQAARTFTARDRTAIAKQLAMLIQCMRNGSCVPVTSHTNEFLIPRGLEVLFDIEHGGEYEEHETQNVLQYTKNQVSDIIEYVKDCYGMASSKDGKMYIHEILQNVTSIVAPIDPKNPLLDVEISHMTVNAIVSSVMTSLRE
jgi:hypothetical protein